MFLNLEEREENIASHTTGVEMSKLIGIGVMAIFIGLLAAIALGRYLFAAAPLDHHMVAMLRQDPNKQYSDWNAICSTLRQRKLGGVSDVIEGAVNLFGGQLLLQCLTLEFLLYMQWKTGEPIFAVAVAVALAALIAIVVRNMQKIEVTGWPMLAAITLAVEAVFLFATFGWFIHFEAWIVFGAILLFCGIVIGGSRRK